MPMGYRLSEEDKAEIIRLWKVEGMTKHGIATALGVNVQCIRRHIRKCGLDDR